MGTLVSPGVDVTVNNRSYFSPAAATTVPLLVVATKANKLQPDGITPAVGTLESGVVREVTSRQQLLSLYGVPDFRVDSAGNPHHGDSRNEYGLEAAMRFLGVAKRVYIIRADIDLADSEAATFVSAGIPVIDQTTLSMAGDGNGTLTAVTIGSAAIKLQSYQVTFVSKTAFAVRGSVDGYIGTGIVGTPFVSTRINLTVTAGTTAYSAGDVYTFSTKYDATPASTNAGNGTVANLVIDTLAVPEVVTITLDTLTTFQVSGTVSGPFGSGIVGQPYDDNHLNFTLKDGTVPFSIGDQFTVTLSSVTVPNRLGANDAARRVAIVTALNATVNGSPDIRSKKYEFNLLSCPGYFEVVPQLVALNLTLREETVQIAGCPCNKTPAQTATWALSQARTISTSVAYYYPWALTTNVDGATIVACPESIALATIAYSDQSGYVWDAPAGLRRGLIAGIDDIVYITGELGTATTAVSCPIGSDDVASLYEYDKNVNPFIFEEGEGFVVWGQKTSAPAASAEDRLNVKRMVCMLRRRMRKVARPFVFEANSAQTRGDLKAACDAILVDTQHKGGLYAFASQCDLNNNTADVIDRNELRYDCAIKPTKTAEFIYITITEVNTGAKI